MKELLERIRKHPACDTGDALLNLGYRPDKIAMFNLMPAFELTRTIAGPAVTIQYVLSRDDADPAEVRRLMYTPIDEAEPGSVLVIAGGLPHFGLFGDVLGTSCKAKGFQGVILESGTKDSMGLKELDLPTFCYRPCLLGALFGKYAKPVACNTPVVCDGVEVNPGDIVCADNDGICVFPADILEKVVEWIDKQFAKEEEAKKKLASGISLFEAYPS